MENALVLGTLSGLAALILCLSSSRHPRNHLAPFVKDFQGCIVTLRAMDKCPLELGAIYVDAVVMQYAVLRKHSSVPRLLITSVDRQVVYRNNKKAIILTCHSHN